MEIIIWISYTKSEIRTFLHEMNSSLSTALRMLSKLTLGWTRHLAVDSIDIWRGPVSPSLVIRVCSPGVRRNGTGRWALRQPGGWVGWVCYLI